MILCCLKQIAFSAHLSNKKASTVLTYYYSNVKAHTIKKAVKKPPKVAPVFAT